MRSAASMLATVLVAIIVIWALFKLLGLAFKLVGVLIVVALAVGAYYGAQKLIGKS